jgi:hypothetical protein
MLCVLSSLLLIKLLRLTTTLASGLLLSRTLASQLGYSIQKSLVRIRRHINHLLGFPLEKRTQLS